MHGAAYTVNSLGTATHAAGLAAAKGHDALSGTLPLAAVDVDPTDSCGGVGHPNSVGAIAHVPALRGAPFRGIACPTPAQATALAEAFGPGSLGVADTGAAGGAPSTVGADGVSGIDRLITASLPLSTRVLSLPFVFSPFPGAPFLTLWMCAAVPPGTSDEATATQRLGDFPAMYAADYAARWNLSAVAMSMVVRRCLEAALDGGESGSGVGGGWTVSGKGWAAWAEPFRLWGEAALATRAVAQRKAELMLGVTATVDSFEVAYGGVGRLPSPEPPTGARILLARLAGIVEEAMGAPDARYATPNMPYDTDGKDHDDD
jgi:hypothetical protein